MGGARKASWEHENSSLQMVEAAHMNEQFHRDLKFNSKDLSEPEVIDALLKDLCDFCQAATSLSGSSRSGEQLKVQSVGAHRLGVMSPGDEVDCVVIVPLTLNLGDVCNSLKDALSKDPSVKCIRQADPDSLFAAPGLKFERNGFRVKMLLTQDIQGLPEATSEAIVPNRVGMMVIEAADTLLSSVPDVGRYRSLLRFVRYWARQRGIYGSSYGFLGGLAWAVVCAHICQSYPSLDVPQLASVLFRQLSRWDWRQPCGLLQPGAKAEEPQDVTAPAPGTEGGGLLPSQGMVISFPGNSSVNVTTKVLETTARIMQKELRRGYKMVQQVESGRASWSDISTKTRIFQRHRHYLEFDFMATSETILAAWSDWGRQRMNDLVRLFEGMINSRISLRPWPELLEFKDSDWAHSQAIFVGLHLERGGEPTAEGEHRSFDLREIVVKFLEVVIAWPEADKHLNQFELLIRHVRRSELEQWLENQQKGLVFNNATRQAAGSSGRGVLMPILGIEEGGDEAELQNQGSD